MTDFLLYLAVSAGVTYLIRMLPLVLVQKKIQNRFLLSFLHYIPYAVLSAMTIPACFFATGHIASAAIGFAVAFLLACRGKSLLTVAIGIAASVCLAELLFQIYI